MSSPIVRGLHVALSLAGLVWLYPLLGLFVSFAFAFPLFLLQRERHLPRERGRG